MPELRAIPTGEPSPVGTGAPDDLDALLRRSSTGDEAAYASLYDKVAPRLYGLVLRVVRDRAQAEEVAQEVLLEIWRTSARFDSKLGSPMGWMMTIAHRRAVDRVRSAEASAQRTQRYHDTNHDVAHDSTAEHAEASIEAQRIRRALATLTSAQRSALELAYFGGYTHAEIASLLDLPLGTAKTRIRDGLIRLRDTLGVQV